MRGTDGGDRHLCASKASTFVCTSGASTLRTPDMKNSTSTKVLALRRI